MIAQAFAYFFEKMPATRPSRILNLLLFFKLREVTENTIPILLAL